MAWRLQAGGGCPHIFRSYPGGPSPQGEPTHKPAATCQIWEAVRATCATPPYFPAVKIDGEYYIDGGDATNHPVREAVKELQGIRKDPSVKPLVISIGPGLGFRNKAPFFVPKSIDTAIQAQGDLEKREFRKSFTKESAEIEIDYFCFDVDYGLEDIELDTWSLKKEHGTRVFETIETITLRTEEYLQRPEVAVKLRRCAQALVSRQI